EHYRDELGLELLPGTGPLAAVVPGSVGGWIALLRDHGTMPLGEVLRFAIDYAENGYPVVPRVAATIRAVESLFREEWAPSAEVYLSALDAPLHRNSQLAQTYRRLVASPDPMEEWYEGFVAEAIVDFQEQEWMDSSGVRHRGLLSADDLREWRPTYERP